ncbi:MAG TPA: MFS transporter [Gaiellaceae bacterium]|nr:MFS transporter [Gaiellaceae bacterium]
MPGIRARLAESAAALRGVFANPGLRRVELAFAGAAIGKYAFSLSVAIYAFHHGGATAVGVVAAIRYAVSGVIAPFAATLSDRYPRRRVMLASDLGRLCCVAAIAAIVADGGPRLAVYVLAVAGSVFGTVFRPAEASLLPVLAVSPEELTAANVASSTFDSVGIFAGPALAAFLFALGGATSGFALVAVTFLWSSLNVLRIPATPEPRVDDALPEEGFGALVGGFRAIAGEPRLRLLIGLYSAQCLAAGALTVLVVATAIDRLGLGNAGVGLLQAACGVGAVVGAGVTLSLVGRKRLAGDFALGLVAWGLPLVAVGLVVNTAVTAIALGVLGIGNTMVDITAITLIQRTAVTEVAGRVFGVLEGALVASLALGALAAPALISAAGLRTTLIVAGSFLPVLAVLSWRQLGRIDAGAHVPEAQVAALRTVPFLAVLPLQTIEYLAERVADVSLRAGEELFRRGDHGDRFYVLREGVLAVELDAGDKRLEAPAYVGEIALLHDVPRTATVRVVEDAQLTALERQDFLAAVTGQARARARADDVVGARLGAATG